MASKFNKKGGIDSIWKCFNILINLLDILMTNEDQMNVKLALDIILIVVTNIKPAKQLLEKEIRSSKALEKTLLKIPHFTSIVSL